MQVHELAQILFINKLKEYTKPSVKVIRAIKRQAYKEANVFFEVK